MKKILLAVVVLLLCIVAIEAFARRPVYAERPWGQGYETGSTYMQPDHGYMYYWLMYHTFSNVQPTYHVYVPPAGYAPNYRPWTPRPLPPITKPLPSPTQPFRSSGGFSKEQPVAPAPAPAQSFRSSGGFAKQPPPPVSSPRTSGGFSRAERPAAPRNLRISPRTSGGFSGPRK